MAVLRASIRELHQVVPVRFKSVDVGDVYFRSVYVAIQQDPAIIELEQYIREKLGKDAPPPCYPHMSFFYIDDSEAQERQRIVEHLKKDGTIRPENNGVVLRCPSEDVTNGYEDVGGFEGSEIWIVECEGKVEEWKVLEKVFLEDKRDTLF